jgi:arsenate-mycothiol transferase
VLFVCVRNAGKSQLAAGLMRSQAGAAVQVDSAGTEPGERINELAAESLAELGIDISAEVPRAVSAELVRRADLVVLLGRDAQLDPVPGVRCERWDTVEPSQQGIEGLERMRLVRDDISRRVAALLAELSSPTT